MLASTPVSILNHKSPLQGIPGDSHFRKRALVLRPGGALVMANTAHGNGWTCDSQHIRTLFVTAEDLRWHLADAGFALETLRDIQSSDVSWRDQGYSRVLVSQAVKA
jgi:hypothetical protein